MKKQVPQFAWSWLLLFFTFIVLPAFSQNIPLQPTMADIEALPDQEKIAYQKGVDAEDATKGFFAWNDGIHGTELWTWDFTGIGEASMLADLFPGLDAMGNLNSSSPHDFFTYCDKLYFLAQSEYNLGTELWVVDGESQPTRVFDQTLAIQNLRSPIVWHNTIYFIADDVLGDMTPYVWFFDNLNLPFKAPYILPGMACFPVEKLISTGVDILLVKMDPNTGKQILWAYDGEREPRQATDYIPIPSQDIHTVGIVPYIVKPNVQLVRPTEAWFCWRWDGTASATITIATDYGLTQNIKVFNLPQMGSECRYQVNGLEPGRTYYYKFSKIPFSSLEEPARGSFRTPLSDGSFQKCKLVIYGDTRTKSPVNPFESNGARFEVRDAIISKSSKDLLVHLGDFGYGGNVHNYINDFFEMSDGIFRQVAWIPTYGNHEFLDIAYQNGFSLDHTKMKEYLWDRDVYYYSYNYQNVHFIVMFVPYYLESAQNWYDSGSLQLNWVKNDLIEAKQKYDRGEIDFIIPVFHRWLVQSKANSSQPNNITLEKNPWFASYRDLFKKYGVQIVFQACAHLYEDVFYEGIHWITTGGGGAPIEHFTSIDNKSLTNEVGWVFERKPIYNFIVLDIDKNGQGSPTLTFTPCEVEKNSSTYKEHTSHTIIRAYPIRVTSPNGGESWSSGSTNTISWISANNVNYVKIELLRDGALVPSNLPSSIAASLGSYSWTIPTNLFLADSYKIRITNLDDTMVSDSSDANFSINEGGVPNDPVLNSPADNAEVCTTTPTFKWSAVTATPVVDYYQVQINIVTTIGEPSTKLYVSANLTDASFTVPTNILESGKNYKWFVRAHNAVGWGEWSGRNLSISVFSVPDVPVLNSPANNATVCTLRPTFKWEAVTACPVVNYYQVQINIIITPGEPSTKLYVSTNIASTSYTLPANILEGGKNYKWFVRAHNAEGWGEWSGRNINITVFTVPVNPILNSPADNATISSTRPTFIWSAISACPALDYYQVQVNIVPASGGPSTKLYVSANLTATSFTMPANILESGKKYKWFVRAHNSEGWGGWSGRNIIIQ